MRLVGALVLVAAATALTGCAAPAGAPPVPVAGTAPVQDPLPTESDRQPTGPRPRWTPRLAWLAGYMPLRSTGVDSFRLAHPAADGRGVLIAILDTGVDPSVAGLRETTTGEPKLLDLRDFSGEGRVPLQPVLPDRSGSVTVGGVRVAGFGQVAGRAGRPYFGGVLREQAFGVGAAADLNGNGHSTDRFPVVVAKGSAGWFAVVDRDLDGSFDGDEAMHDFAVAGQVLLLGRPDGGAGPAGLAVNLEQDAQGDPHLTFVVDNSGHGTHVAGIAAGHNLFDVEGFDGVAPGAQLLGLKISDNARGAISVTGSMLRALNYATDVAARRRMPLVINLSYGVGHAHEGDASIDSIVDQFTLKHPDVPVIVSLGNDGPGLSSTWLPASAEHVTAVCGLLPGVFASPPVAGVPAPPDRIRWWSSRGGEFVKPDVCAPGIAYSSVPAWRAGEEISDGTSMAAPHVAGVAALLISAARSVGRAPRAVDVQRALTNTASPVPGATVLDAGRGVVDAPAAYRWLLAGHQSGVYTVRALDSSGRDRGVPGAYFRDGLPPGDTIQRFVVRSVAGQPAARLRLAADAPWLTAPPATEPEGGIARIDVRYDPAWLASPGVYVGTVWAVPESDTLAGPSFGLTSTIIVPYTLDRALERRGAIGPGEIARYPVAVPPGAGGLRARMVVDDTTGGTLHVFEPDGRPYRDRRSAVAGRGAGQAARVDVLGSDIVPGTYELVVAAPPTDSLRFALEVSLPAVRVVGAPTLGAAEIVPWAGAPVQAAVEMRWIGMQRERRVTGLRGAPARVRVDPPAWAQSMLLDLAVDLDSWPSLTDFGVTVFDEAQRVVSAGPLAYADKRGVVPLDTARGASFEIELAPSFAHLTPPDEWSASLRITYIPSDPVPLAFDSLGTRIRSVAVPENGVVVRAAPPDVPAMLPGYRHVLEVLATDPRGVTARWRGPVDRNE